MYKYRVAIFVFLSLLMCKISSAQQYMKFSWTEENINYFGFAYLIDSDNVVVRINSMQNGVLKLADAKAKLKVRPPYAPKSLVLDISMAKVIYSKDGNKTGRFPSFKVYQDDYDPVKAKASGRSYVALATKIDKRKYMANLPDVNVYTYSRLADAQNSINPAAYFLKDEAYFKLFSKPSTSVSATAPATTSAINNTPTSNINTQPSGPVTIHLVLLGDTKDISIGASVKNDLNSMRSLFQNTMGVNKNIRFNIKEVSGDKLTALEVQNTVKSLTVGANDAVIVYYSGHGTNPLNSNSNFPTASLIKSSYRLEDLSSLADSHKPRLSIVIGDLCNSVSRATSPVATQAFTRSAAPQYDPARVAKLLINAKGKLISTSSKYDEYSYSIGNNGVFTEAFVGAMNATVVNQSSLAITWDAVLTRSYQDALYRTRNIVNKTGTKGQNGFYGGNVTYN